MAKVKVVSEKGKEGKKLLLALFAFFAYNPLATRGADSFLAQELPDAVLTVGRLPRDDVQIHAGADRLLEAH